MTAARPAASLRDKPCSLSSSADFSSAGRSGAVTFLHPPLEGRGIAYEIPVSHPRLGPHWYVSLAPRNRIGSGTDRNRRANACWLLRRGSFVGGRHASATFIFDTPTLEGEGRRASRSECATGEGFLSIDRPEPLTR